MRRVIASATTVLVSTSAIGVLGAPSASGACSVVDHCYGIVSSRPATIDGIKAIITPYCLTAPIGGFVTAEVWLANTAGTHWVEVGYIDHWVPPPNNVPGLPQGRYGFWFESRPSGFQQGHTLVNGPSLIARAASITRTSSTTFLVNFGGATATAPSNSMATDRGDIGSETTSASAHSYGYYNSMAHYAGGSWASQLGTPVFRTADPPQTQGWNTQLQTMHAGVPC